MEDVSRPKTFTQILSLIQAEPLSEIPEELLTKVCIKSEAQKNYLLKKLRWLIFQYERDIFLNQEMIEFLKWGDLDQIRLLIKLLYKLKVKPFKRSWISILLKYHGAKPPNVKFPDIGKMIATNFFKVIKIEKVEKSVPVFNDIKLIRSKPKNIFTIIKEAKQERLPFKVINRPRENVNPPTLPGIISLNENVQGSDLKKSLPFPKILDKQKILHVLNKTIPTEFKPPKFKCDIIVSICEKFYLSEKFAHGKKQLDPPDIIITTIDYSALLPKLIYNSTRIHDTYYYWTKMISKSQYGIGDYTLGVDIIMMDKKLTIPSNWRLINPIKYGFMVLAQDLEWNGCLGKIKKMDRRQIEFIMEKDQI